MKNDDTTFVVTQHTNTGGLDYGQPSSVGGSNWVYQPVPNPGDWWLLAHQIMGEQALCVAAAHALALGIPFKEFVQTALDTRQSLIGRRVLAESGG